jgi:hypothetical protein
MVAYDPSYLGGRSRRIKVQCQPGQNVSEIPSQKRAGSGGHICDPSYLGGEDRKITKASQAKT